MPRSVIGSFTMGKPSAFTLESPAALALCAPDAGVLPLCVPPQPASTPHSITAAKNMLNHFFIFHPSFSFLYIPEA